MKTQLEKVRVFNADLSLCKFTKLTNLKRNSIIKINLNLRNDLPKTKNGAYVKNLEVYKSIGTHWIVLYVNGNNAIYFESFGVEHLPKGIKERKEQYHNKYL